MSPEKGLELVKSVKSVSRETEQRLTDYFKILCQWQKQINLISPKTVDQIWQRHIADSMQCAVMAGTPNHLIDIGSGAGFPGMVIAIVMAETGAGRVDFIESAGKKCAFLRTVVRELRLKGTGLDVEIHHGRIEKVLPCLGQPDVITARALAPLPDLLNMTKPLLNKGAIGIFPKGRDHQSEIIESEKKWSFKIEKKPSQFEENSVLLKISEVNPR